MEANNEFQPIEKDTSAWFSPIVITAVFLIISVVILIGATLFGFNKGDILGQLKNGEYARGLITYLFSIGTIGSFVVLILAALVGKGSKEEREDRFKNAKDVFSLLIGIFGSIIGFYFGSIIAEKEIAAPQIVVAEPIVERTDPLNFTIMSHISGGVPPYFYYIKVKNNDSMPIKRTKEWIREDILKTMLKSDSVFQITLSVFDTKGDSIVVQKEVLRPKN
ncbi:hypothetical protein AHMF7605_03370 [Adhaeribacter arboris]|uniref:Uncharacterized protein n=1 Tax=Adhaeribacter arboris TaxID=2072846 RepID=A0A2T2YAR8_9BACT|nr:hypothetical protein [Adhaeribacter arboris]PSR52631.1 hypothetical protein AHMF7605_03370 [Adhaeribacter arboris]